MTSELVVLEASAGDATAAAERVAALGGLKRLDVTETAILVADALVSALAIPKQASRDALPVGICAANGIDYLLTWNFRHLANAMLRDRISEVCVSLGFRPSVICTPEQLPEERS